MNYSKDRIYIIDGDCDVRKSLHSMFSASSTVIWPFESATDFLTHLPQLSPAPILLEIRMANIDGLRLLKILRDRDVSWPVVVLTAHGSVKMGVRAMKLGALEFIEEPFEPEVLEQALDAAFGILNRGEHGH